MSISVDEGVFSDADGVWEERTMSQLSCAISHHWHNEAVIKVILCVMIHCCIYSA